VVPAPGAVGVELVGFHALFGEPLTGGLLTAERAGRADVVGRDRITEQHQRAGVVDICDTGLFQREVLEEGRLADVRRRVVPLVDLTGRRIECRPAFVSLEHGGVLLFEHRGIDTVVNRRVDLVGVGPDVREIDRIAVGIRSERVVFEVDVHPPGEAIGDDERRAGEVVRTNLRVDASLEVAVPRKDARGPGSSASIARSIGSGSGPAFPIQVVQP